MASADHGAQPPDADHDLKLLRRAQQGDDAAFEELMSRYSDLFHALASFLVGRSADAEDVVQDTFLAAYESMRSFQARSSVKTWLSAILLRRAALCHRRSSARRSAQSGRLSDASRALLNGNTAASLTAASDVKMDVLAVLQTLQPDHREIVVLREMDGMSYQQIADVLDLPGGTVESRLFRARQELKMRLKDYKD
ncbi:MAG: sigma-70 family RNA polymerase sigma factor [Planctomycetota bacterium]|nr:sigma-70 family RNA polymerase sigma factor [Planctomycetota bacterium]